MRYSTLTKILLSVAVPLMMACNGCIDKKIREAREKDPLPVMYSGISGREFLYHGFDIEVMFDGNILRYHITDYRENKKSYHSASISGQKCNDIFIDTKSGFDSAIQKEIPFTELTSYGLNPNSPLYQIYGQRQIDSLVREALNNSKQFEGF